MIDHNDKVKRKQVAADLIVSVVANHTTHPEPDAPTVILEMGQPSHARVDGALKDMNARYSAWHYGFWSRCNLGDRRWFWVAQAYGRKCLVDWVVYGFAESERQAVASAHQAITEDFPVGFCFRWGSAAGAADTYTDHFAKKPWFADNWRKRFPLWAHQAHLYAYGATSHQSHDPQEETLRVVAVTQESVFVYRPSFVPTEQASNFDMQCVLTRDCIPLSREALETEGRATAPKASLVCYVESQLLRRSIHAAAIRPRVEELRRTMQKEHPDKGGDVEVFMSAQQEYKQLKRGVAND